jgi:hypothetical protein
VIMEEDEGALRLCAEAFEKCRVGIMACIFLGGFEGDGRWDEEGFPR